MFTGSASEGAIIDTAMRYGIKKYDQHWTKKHGKSIKNVLGSKAATSSGAPHDSMSGGPSRKARYRQDTLPYKRKKPRIATRTDYSRQPVHDEPPPSRRTFGPKRAPQMSIPFLRPRRLAGKRKAVSLPKMSSQYRFQHHENVVQTTVHKALWYGGSSLGSGEDACMVLADAMICHYLRRLNDSRSSRTTSAGATSGVMVWNHMDIVFGTVGQEQTTTTLFEVDSDNDSSRGLTLTNDSIDDMVATLAGKLEKMYLNTGMVPIRVSIRKDDFYGAVGSTVPYPDRQVLDDTDAYRNQYSLSISGLFKIHNVTVPSPGEYDKHAINAQPIDGKLYNFRNRVPVFHPSYLAPLSTTIGQVSNLANDPVATGISMASYETGVNYDALNSGTANPVELETPPLRPGIVFKNSTSSEKVYMAPGAMKYRKTYFSMAGSLMSIFKRILPLPFNAQTTSGTAGLVPPGGDSFLVCLKPTVKISNSEVVTIDTHHSHMFKAHCKKGKMLLLPTKQYLE